MNHKEPNVKLASFRLPGLGSRSTLPSARSLWRHAVIGLSGLLISVGAQAANQAPVATLTGPAAGAVYTAPATIVFTATASDPDGTVDKVVFYANGTRLASDYGAPYKYTWSNVPAGTYTLYATATDNQNRTASSASRTITVFAPTPPPPPDPDPGTGGGTGSTTSFGPSIVPGVRSGNFQVTPSGAASYSMAIPVPPGVSGVEPAFSLSYSSQGGSGLLGTGFGLEGVSAISRCAKSMATDGVRGGAVNLDVQDRFCMDGQRLMLVSGTYGAAGSEYRTEQDSFSRVIANGVASGSAANGPESFTVMTKGGLKLQYGTTGDSRIEAQGKSVVATWALSKTEDVKGNAVDYTYLEDNANGHWRIVSASYAGRSVNFSYETRSDPSVAYVAGSPTRENVRLSSVETRIGAAVVHRVSVTYEVTGPFQSLVKNIQLCDGSNRCAVPQEFTWAPLGPATFANGYWLAHAGQAANNVVGDFNGDGMSDLAGHLTNDDWDICFSNGTSFNNCVVWRGTHHMPYAVADFDGNGTSDMAHHAGDTTTSNWRVCLFSGAGSSCGTWGSGYQGWTSTTKSGDLNGDGRADIFDHRGSGAWQVCLSNGSSFTCGTWSGLVATSANTTTGDFNGDGLIDIAAYTGSGAQWHVCLSTGSGFSCTYQSIHTGGGTSNVAADYNGDGLTDMAKFDGGTSWTVCLSTGKGFSCSAWAGHSGGATNNKVGDFNNDGRMDMVSRVSGGTWNVCLSTGSTFACNYWVGHDENNNDIGDFNGDGSDDLIGFHGTSGSNWRVSLSQAQTIRQVSDIKRGSHQININYQRLTGVGASAVYSAGAAVAYPRMNVKPTIKVVKSSGQSNGVGGMNTSTYTYGGMRAEHADVAGHGHGNLGFLWTSVKEDATGIVAYNEFSQNWPHIGQTILSETRKTGAGNAGVLKRTSPTFACYVTNGAAPTTGCASPLAGQPLFPFKSSITEESWDLNGTPMPTIKTTTNHAGTADESGAPRQFGDATQVQAEIYQGATLKHRKLTSNEFHPAKTSGTDWRLGRLKKASVTSTQY